jgi:hypothetical protein
VSPMSQHSEGICFGCIFGILSYRRSNTKIFRRSSAEKDVILQPHANSIKYLGLGSIKPICSSCLVSLARGNWVETLQSSHHPPWGCSSHRGTAKFPNNSKPLRFFEGLPRGKRSIGADWGGGFLDDICSSQCVLYLHLG